MAIKKTGRKTAAKKSTKKPVRKAAKAAPKKKAVKGTVVLKNAVKREKGMAYFVDGSGNLRKVKMHVGGKKGAKRCSRKK